MGNQEIELELHINVSRELIAEAHNETGRLERYIDRLLAKLASIITLSGILTFVSLGFISTTKSTQLVKYYLVWVFPFLFISIVLWVFTIVQSKSITIDRIDVVDSADPRVELQYLQARLGMANTILGATKRIYFHTRHLFVISLAFICVYMLVYIVSFYMFVFSSLPSGSASFILALLSVSTVIFLYLQFSSQRKRVHTETIQVPKKSNPKSTVGRMALAAIKTVEADA